MSACSSIQMSAPGGAGALRVLHRLRRAACPRVQPLSPWQRKAALALSSAVGGGVHPQPRVAVLQPHHRVSVPSIMLSACALRLRAFMPARLRLAAGATPPRPCQPAPDHANKLHGRHRLACSMAETPASPAGIWRRVKTT